MRMKSLILIFIALGCGLVASIGISQVMERGTGAGGEVEMEEILVALKDIDINASFDAQNVKLEPWPKIKLQEGVIRNLDEVKDMFAKQRIIKGEPILMAKVTDQIGQVAPLIPAGYRVLPVSIAEDTVMKGISPGDRVDVNLHVKRGEEIRETGTYTIMQAVRVFSVGLNTEKVAEAKGGDTAFRTVSLIVTPEQMRHLIGAAAVGKITLGLRHPNEPIDETNANNVTPLPDILKANTLDNQEEIQPQNVASAAPPAPAGPSLLDTFGKAFASMAEKAKNTKPEELHVDDESHTMHIYTNSEVKQYQWQDRDGLPQESTLFSAGVSGTGSSPAPAPAAGAGNMHRPGYLPGRRPVWMTETSR